MKNLLALIVIAAGTLAADSPELSVGTAFEAPDDMADHLIATGQASLAPAEATPPAAAPRAQKTVQVRLLCDGPYGKVNQVVSLASDVAKSAESAGIADSSKAAVAYALTLVQEKPTT